MEEESQKKVKTFKELGLCDSLVKACDHLQWKTPTEIQAQAIPYALQGKDIIGVAKTGTGKTGAFALPILQALLDSNPSMRPFFACVIAPTRELAIQIAELFQGLGADIGLKTAVLVGKVDTTQQQIALAKRPHIIVATPGRLMDHLSNTRGFSLHTMEHLVLDEADRLLDLDFEKALDDIFKVIPRKRKTYLFSATMTKKVKKLQRVCLRNPVKIETASKYSIVDTLKQQFLLVPDKYKDCYLVYLLMKMSECKSIVFTETCEKTHKLALMLRNLGLKAMPFNGKMSQAKRLGALNKFKAGDCNILVCTGVAGRGLDIPSVDVVIIYNVPEDPKTYKHWVGRTARAGGSGVSITLVHQLDVGAFCEIERRIGKKLPLYPVEEEEVLLLNERVTVARSNAEKDFVAKEKRKFTRDRECEEIDRYMRPKRQKRVTS